MAVTHSDRGGFIKPNNFEQSNIWGTDLNNSTDLVDEALFGVIDVDMGNSNQTLTTTDGSSNQSRQSVIQLTGTLTANRTLTIPNQEWRGIILNSTLGGFNVSIGSHSLNNGEMFLVWRDGAGQAEQVRWIPDRNDVVRTDGTNLFVRNTTTALSSLVTQDGTNVSIGNSNVAISDLNELDTLVANKDSYVTVDSDVEVTIGDNQGIRFAGTESGRSILDTTVRPWIRVLHSNDTGIILAPGETADGQIRIETNGASGAKFISFVVEDAEYGSISRQGNTGVNYTSGSDKRMKKNIADMGGAVQIVEDLRPVVFEWKDAEDGNHDTGFIAQEVRKVLPHLVHENKDGYLSLDYSKFVPVLCQALKDTMAAVGRLEQKVEELENK